jgi:hypothetical protein
LHYERSLDAGEVQTIVGCFTADGALVSPAVGSHTDEAALREFVRRFARFRERGAQLRWRFGQRRSASKRPEPLIDEAELFLGIKG